MPASISVVLERAPAGDHTTSPHESEDLWTSVASADFTTENNFGCFYFEKNMLLANGDEWVVILEPKNIDVNWLDDFPNAYDLKINSNGEITFEFDNASTCNDDRYSHSHFYVDVRKKSPFRAVQPFKSYEEDDHIL